MARLLNLEANSLSKTEANPKLDEFSDRLTNLEDSRIEYRATIEAWISSLKICGLKPLRGLLCRLLHSHMATIGRKLPWH